MGGSHAQHLGKHERHVAVLESGEQPEGVVLESILKHDAVRLLQEKAYCPDSGIWIYCSKFCSEFEQRKACAIRHAAAMALPARPLLRVPLRCRARRLSSGTRSGAPGCGLPSSFRPSRRLKKDFFHVRSGLRNIPFPFRRRSAIKSFPSLSAKGSYALLSICENVYGILRTMPTHAAPAPVPIADR